MSKQTNRTDQLRDEELKMAKARDAQHERGGPVEEADPIAPGADGKGGDAGEAETEAHPS